MLETSLCGEEIMQLQEAAAGIEMRKSIHRAERETDVSRLPAG